MQDVKKGNHDQCISPSKVQLLDKGMRIFMSLLHEKPNLHCLRPKTEKFDMLFMVY